MRCSAEKWPSCILLPRPVTSCIIASSSSAASVLRPARDVTGRSHRNSLSTATHLLCTDWIEVRPDQWMSAMGRMLRTCASTSVSQHRTATEKSLHNSVFVIGPSGQILDRHRKTKTLRIGSESSSSPGPDVQSIVLGDDRRVGAMISADAYSPNTPQKLQRQGASILVCPAAWAPPYGPNGKWERSTVDTGLPLFRLQP